MDKVYIISGLLSFLSFPLIAQNSDYQAQYREKVLEYNQDLKAAGYNEAMKQEMIKSPVRISNRNSRRKVISIIPVIR